MIKYDASSITDGKHSSSGNKNDYPATGYVITKYIHDDDSYSSPSGVISEKFFPIIRYAEILLAYSEALNNLQGSHSIELTMPNGETKTYTENRDLNKIKRAFNQIRYRVGLPGVKDSDLSAWIILIKLFKEKELLNSYMKIKDTMTYVDGVFMKRVKRSNPRNGP